MSSKTRLILILFFVLGLVIVVVYLVKGSVFFSPAFNGEFPVDLSNSSKKEPSPPPRCEFNEVKKFTASDASPGDLFGSGVSVGDDVFLVSSNYHDCDNGRREGCGSAYVFKYNGNEWIEEDRLTASDTHPHQLFGSVSLITDYMAVIGARGDNANNNWAGAAYVFKYNGNEWIEEDKLTASDGTKYGGFGSKVVGDGDVVVISSPWHDCHAGYGRDNCGSVYVFRYNGNEWIEEAELISGEEYRIGSGVQFGYSVAVANNVIVVGTPYIEKQRGAVYVFRYNGNEWLKEAKLTPLERKIDASFGERIAIDSNSEVILVGSSYESDEYGNTGAAYVFRYNGNEWVEEQRLESPDPRQWDFFGEDVSVDGEVIVTGAIGKICDGEGQDCGAAYVFRYNGNEWMIEEDKLTASDGIDGDFFGKAIVLNGNKLFISSSAICENGHGENCGATYLFEKTC